MQLHHYIIALMAFSVVIILMLGLSTDMVNNYADMGITISYDPSAGDTLNRVNETMSQVQSMQQNLQGQDIGTTSSLTTFLGGGWSVLMTVINSFTITSTLIRDIAGVFHIPSIAVTFLTGALIITIIFTAIYMIFQSKGE